MINKLIVAIAAFATMAPARFRPPRSSATRNISPPPAARL